MPSDRHGMYSAAILDLQRIVASSYVEMARELREVILSVVGGDRVGGADGR
ncbi:MAG: hypothetical protein QI197_08355 [Candidatus Korarchaeota archaeon]|nr:hypothetical protein [Candidatus Korarchaeota archaeon]